jgi:membrane protease YdiL (CAAX protease family)
MFGRVAKIIMEISKETSASDPVTAPAAPPSSAPMQSVFWGPQGLRAGWRLAIYAALYSVLRFILSLVIGALSSGSRGRLPPLWAFLFTECVLAIIAMAPALFMCRLEHRPFWTYGLSRQGAFGKNFWAGAAWGFVAFTVLILVMRGTGVFSFGGLALHGIRVLKFAAFWGVMFLVVGFREEFLFRGYTQFTLSDGIGFWPAVLLLSAGFGYVHSGNPGESGVGILGVVVIGVFFCFTLRRTGTLWFAVGMHAAWDWSETFFYSVPDSGLVLPGHLLNSSFHGSRWITGGSVGPEGSVLLFVLVAVMWVVFDRVYPHVAYPPQSHRESRLE